MEQQDSDDDFDRDGDPLSLQELDGWMNQVNQKNELQDDELEESIQDQARVEEGEDTYSTPVNDTKRSKQQTFESRRKEESSSSDDELQIDLIDKAQQRHSLNRIREGNPDKVF